MTFSSAGSGQGSVLLQYLVHRIAAEADISNSSQSRPCLADKNGSIPRETSQLQAKVSDELTYLSLVLIIPAVFTCLLMGSYADHVACRSLILIQVFTNFLRTSVVCCVIRFQLDLSFPHLAYGIDGVAGSWYFLLVALISLTADISQSKKDRTFWISFVPFAVSIMATVINVAAGYLKKSYDSFEATAFLCTLMLLAFTCPLHFLLETLQRDRSVKGFNWLSHSRKIFGFYFLDENLRRRAMFCLCLLLFVVGVGSDLNLGSLDSLCQVHYPFCWESTQIGDYSAVRLAGSNFCGVMLFTARQMCVSVEYTDMFGVLFQGGALVSEAFIQVSWQFYLVPVILIPGVPTVFITKTMLSMLAGPDHQGSVFSSVAIMECLCNLISTQIYNRIYLGTVNFMPGAVYLVMASISLTTFSLFGICLLVRERAHLYEVKVAGNLSRRDHSEGYVF